MLASDQALFAIQHSVIVRKEFNPAWTRIAPKPIAVDLCALSSLALVPLLRQRLSGARLSYHPGAASSCSPGARRMPSASPTARTVSGWLRSTPARASSFIG